MIGGYIHKTYHQVGAIPTEFIFNIKPQTINLIGNVRESESITKFDPIFQLDQSYFENQSTFTQLIKTNNISDDISAVIGISGL